MVRAAVPVTLCLSLFLGAAAPRPAFAGRPPDVPANGTADAAALAGALDRFKAAFKAARWAEAETAARDAVLAGGGAEALEALAVVALQTGRLPRAHQLYVAIGDDAEAKPDVARRARKQIDSLDRQTGRLVIRGGHTGDMVAIDGDHIGALGSLAPPRAWPGKHTVRVGDFEVEVRFAAGRETQVTAPGSDRDAAGATSAAAAATAAGIAGGLGLAGAAGAGAAGSAGAGAAGTPVAGAAGSAGAGVAAGAVSAAAEGMGGGVGEAAGAVMDAVSEANALRKKLQAEIAEKKALAQALRARAERSRAALSRFSPEAFARMVARDPVLRSELNALKADEQLAFRAAAALQNGGGLEGAGDELMDDPRVKRILDRLRTLIMAEVGEIVPLEGKL
jgi:hypothetical protein